MAKRLGKAVEKKDKKDKKDKKRKKDKDESKEDKREKKRLRRLEKYNKDEAKNSQDGEQDDPTLFDDLFGTEGGSSEKTNDVAKPRPPATPVSAPPQPLASQLREEVTRVLAGVDLQSTQLSLGEVRKKIEANLNLEPGSLDE